MKAHCYIQHTNLHFKYHIYIKQFQDKIFQLKPVEVSPLNHTQVTLKVMRKYWSAKHTEFSDWLHDMINWLMKYWLRTIIITVVLAETFSLNFAVVGIQGWTAQWILKQADRAFAVAHIIITDPLRRIYRRGPIVTTSMGEIGFWENPNDPCDIGECSLDGQFIEIVIDCEEEMGIPCNGEWIEVQGQCCSECVENLDLNQITNKEFRLIKMIDILGREKIEHKEGMILFYIYENGNVIKKIK